MASVNLLTAALLVLGLILDPWSKSKPSTRHREKIRRRCFLPERARRRALISGIHSLHSLKRCSWLCHFHYPCPPFLRKAFIARLLSSRGKRQERVWEVEDRYLPLGSAPAGILSKLFRGFAVLIGQLEESATSLPRCPGWPHCRLYTFQPWSPPRTLELVFLVIVLLGITLLPLSISKPKLQRWWLAGWLVGWSAGRLVGWMANGQFG